MLPAKGESEKIEIAITRVELPMRLSGFLFSHTGGEAAGAIALDEYLRVLI
jgi:hypothetical protein